MKTSQDGYLPTWRHRVDAAVPRCKPDFKMRTDVMPGQVARVRFTPDRAGTFIYLSDIFCGSGHEQMDAHFIVRS
jgi:hypothetical protein